MTETFLIQGRPIGSLELAQVRSLLTEHPEWSRYRLSRHLATLWDWRTLTGQLKDMAARTLLLKLERTDRNLLFRRAARFGRCAGDFPPVPVAGPYRGHLPAGWKAYAPVIA